ncbi:MAG: hypothetical protein RLZZ115_2976, partial [Cyanobacteriota bacterium]
MNLINKLAKVFICILIFNSLIYPVRSQTSPEISLNKPTKSCFSEDAVLPFPPVSQTEPSIPNLWLAEKLYEDKVMKTWYIENNVVQLSPNIYLDALITLVVDREKWNAQQYLGQYVLVNRFATVAQSYGYNLRVCNLQGDLLGYYYCDF